MILTVGTESGLREQVETALRGTQWAAEVGNVASVDEAREILRGATPPRVVIVGESFGVAGGGEVAAAAAGLRNPPLVLLIGTPTTDLLRSAMRAGVRDVLPTDFVQEDLEATLRDAGVAGGGPAAMPGITVAVFSTKGGVGTSVVASNLAVLLGRRTEAPATLVDLDLASADQAIMHGLTPRWTIQDLADGSIGTDVESLEQVLLRIEGSNSRLLAGPVDPALSETISSSDVNSLIATVRAQSPVAVLDTASGFDERTLGALDVADVTVIVTSLDVAALRSLTVSLQTMERLGMDPESILIVLVRADSKSGLTVADVERAISRRIDVGVPSIRQVSRSVNEGVPLAISSPRSSVVAALDELAELLVARLPDDVLATKKDDSGFFSWSPPWSSASSGSRSAGGSDSGTRTGPRQPVEDHAAAHDPTSPQALTAQGPVGSEGVQGVSPEPDADKAAARPTQGTPEEEAAELEPSAPEPEREEESRGADESQSRTRRIRAVPSLGDLPPPTIATEDDDEPQKRRRR